MVIGKLDTVFFPLIVGLVLRIPFDNICIQEMVSETSPRSSV